MKKTIYLHEEFMLLALREETGTIETSVPIEFPLAAAVLSELLLQKRIELDQAKKRKQLVNFINSTPLGDPVLDEALEKIRKAKRRASLKTWVGRIAHLKKLKHRSALQLCKRGILRADEDKVLLIFKRGIYPELDPRPEQRLVERLRKVIFSNIEDIKPRDAIIIALTHHAHLLRKKFDKKDLKTRKKRIKQIAESSPAAKAAKELMDAINVAVIAAVS